MDSVGSISDARRRLMPFLAILQYELRSLWTSWLVRLWFVAAVLLALLTVVTGWGSLRTPILIGSLLFPYLVFPWFLVVAILGISPVTGSRLDALADGILSRSITRYEYLLACWAARVCMALAVFLVICVPLVTIVVFARRPVPEAAVTSYGLIATFSLVGLVLTFLVSLGFLAGTLVRRPLVAAVLLLFVWFPVNLVLDTFALEEFSPISLNRAVPTLLKTPWRTTDNQAGAASAEDMEEMARQAAQLLSLLSGGSPAPPRRESPEFFARDDYEDFALWRVLLGYGLPSLAAVGLATLCFSYRDL
jgi:ABC-type transport system involved in multi-copper enzyme maturation permease subunit